MQKDGVHTRMVHLAIEAEWREFRVPQVRRQEVFCVLTTFPVPDDSPPWLVHTEPQIGEIVDVVGSCGIEHVGRPDLTVGYPHGGLVVGGVGGLRPSQVLLAGSVAAWTVEWLEAVCVRVDNHRFTSVPCCESANATSVMHLMNVVLLSVYASRSFLYFDANFRFSPSYARAAS